MLTYLPRETGDIDGFAILTNFIQIRKLHNKANFTGERCMSQEKISFWLNLRDLTSMTNNKADLLFQEKIRTNEYICANYARLFDLHPRKSANHLISSS